MAPPAQTVLVVDDDPSILTLLRLRLQSAGYPVQTAASGAEALARVEQEAPGLIITDHRMEGMDGMALFQAIRRRNPALPVIMLTAHGTIPDAVDATQRGLFAYLTKPFEPSDLLENVREALRLSSAHGSSDAWRSGIISRSTAMEAVLDKVRLVGGSGSSVMILGRSGTGKEVIARALHETSGRDPFVAVNCAAIPDALFESELFGHRRGAFSGAVSDREGLIVAAHGGTLFLDEVGELPLPMQAKLLRVLQEREVRAVGATRAVPVDVRIVSATLCDLGEAVREGRFREDLLYRLNVVTLQLPGLSERREDIPLLAEHFLRELAPRTRARSFAPKALARLASASWPGNVRQLRNVVERCSALATGPILPEDLVVDALQEPTSVLPTLDEARADAERRYLVQILRLTEGNVSEASRLAGRNRTEFYRLLGRHELDPGAFRGEG